MLYALAGAVVIVAVAALYLKEKKYLERKAVHAGDKPDLSRHWRSRG